MAAWGYLPKLKRSLELAFGAHFLHGLCHIFFPSQDMKQNVLLSSYLGN